ncbi:MAG TPA: cysteine methyltransferase [Acidimicrobiaceae bacterium]|nr:cysteine methyltransferase [Acidimicrobiaceae bacterium]
MTAPTIRRTLLDTPIGMLVLEADDEALVHIELPGADSASRRNGAHLAPDTPNGARKDTGARSGPLADAVAQLGEYFSGRRHRFELPLKLSGTDFQRQVWGSLAEIPYGTTISYAELAAMVGRPTAFRAVGQANGANPLPIVLPCHRVVASGGRIGGYGGGLDMKRRLLALEGLAGM